MHFYSIYVLIVLWFFSTNFSFSADKNLKSEFEENTKKIEELIRQRERNIKLGSVLRDATEAVKARAKNWKEIVKKIETKYPADVAEALTIIGKTKDKEKEESEEYK